MNAPFVEDVRGRGCKRSDDERGMPGADGAGFVIAASFGRGGSVTRNPLFAVSKRGTRQAQRDAGGSYIHP